MAYEVQSQEMFCPGFCTSLQLGTLTIYELEIRHRSRHIVSGSWEYDVMISEDQGSFEIFRGE
jgi:hypothetical protein